MPAPASCGRPHGAVFRGIKRSSFAAKTCSSQSIAVLGTTFNVCHSKDQTPLMILATAYSRILYVLWEEIRTFSPDFLGRGRAAEPEGLLKTYCNNSCRFVAVHVAPLTIPGHFWVNLL